MTGDSIAFHVFGLGRCGECVLVERPQLWWGVIDFYSRGRRPVDVGPVVRLLRERAVSELRFLCITHPHFDHFHGVDALLSELIPREPTDLALWQFWHTIRDHCPVVRALTQETGRLDDAPELSEEEAQVLRDLPHELLDLLTRFKGVMDRRTRRRRSGTARGRDRLQFYRWVGDGAPVYPFDPWPDGVQSDPAPPVRIRVVEPTSDAWTRYVTNVGGRDRDAARIPHPRHNEISAALHVAFGEMNAALLGDGECPTWADARGGDRAGTLEGCRFVKIPHHGSESSHDDELWELLGRGRGPRYAVTTSLRRHGLPREGVLAAIHAHGFNVLSTCPPRGEDREGWGRVSLWFDADGQLLASEFAGDAAVCHGSLP